MIGTIDYLRELKKTCREAEGDCWNCPLGKGEDLNETLCPRLTEPRTWSEEKTTAWQKRSGSKGEYMPTGERKTLFYINSKTGEITELEDIKEIRAETDPAEDFPRINTHDEFETAIKETPKVRRIFQRLAFGYNNRRKANHLPMYRKPAWGRRRKKNDIRR